MEKHQIGYVYPTLKEACWFVQTLGQGSLGNSVFSFVHKTLLKSFGH